MHPPTPRTRGEMRLTEEARRAILSGLDNSIPACTLLLRGRVASMSGPSRLHVSPFVDWIQAALGDSGTNEQRQVACARCTSVGRALRWVLSPSWAHLLRRCWRAVGGLLKGCWRVVEGLLERCGRSHCPSGV